jgi:DNA repair protein RadC
MKYNYDYKKIIEGNLVQKISQLTGIPETDIQKAGVKFTMEHPRAVAKTKAQRWKLELLCQFFREYREAEFVQEEIELNSSSKAGEYFVSRLAGIKTNERFEVAFLDSANKLIATKTMSEGTTNEAPAYPREIAKEALNHDAVSVVLAHNHPGGTLQPSVPDMEVTRAVKSALQALKINLVDHIIVAGNTYTSFAEKGLMPA